MKWPARSAAVSSAGARATAVFRVFFVNDTQVDCPGALMEDEEGTCLRIDECSQKQSQSQTFPDCEDSMAERCLHNHIKCFPRREACLLDTGVLGKQACPNLEHLTHCFNFHCPGQFQCSSDGGGYCVPAIRVCDGSPDCPGGSDEANCEAGFALPFHFRCRGRHDLDIFVPRHRVCDNAPECRNGEDELYCDQTCPPGCYCIGYSVRCEGDAMFQPSEVSVLTRALILDGNRVTKMHSNTLKPFRHLGLLSARSAGLTELPSLMFVNNWNIVELDLRDNQITALKSDSLTGLGNLLQIRLAGNPLAAIDPYAFSSLASIVELPLQDLRIAELPEYGLAGMKKLRVLNLSGNPLRHLHELSFSNGSRRYHAVDIRVRGQIQLHENTFAPLVEVENFLSNNFKFCCLLEHTKANCTPPARGFHTCKDLLGRDGQRIAAWVYGLVAFIGNVLVIGVRLYRRKVKTAADFIIFNVSLADFMMSLYLLSVAIADVFYLGRYIAYDDLWRHHSICSIIGMMFLISAEASITFLALLSLERYLSIVSKLDRDRRLSMRATVIMTVVTWTVCVALSCLLLLQEKEEGAGNAFSRNSACVPLVTNEDNTWVAVAFQSLFVAYNFAAFLLVTICYGRIFAHIRATRKSAHRKTMEQDHLLARRLFVLVSTNLVTWIPTIAMYLCLAIDIYIYPSMVTGFILFILPINPSLNPYLYTLSSMRMFCRETRRKIDQAKVLQAISGRVEVRNSHPLGNINRWLTSPRGSASIETQTVADS